MDTKLGLMVVLALAAGQLVIMMSGYGTHVGGTPADDSEAAKKLNNTDGGAPSQSGSVKGGDDDSDIISLVLSAGSGLVDILKYVAFLPFELERLDPVPWFAAYPVGLVLQVTAAIGLWQFTSGRVYQ